MWRDSYGAEPTFVCITAAALPLALRLQGRLGGRVLGYAHRVPDAPETFGGVAETLQDLFGAGRPIVPLMAVGAVMRILGPHSFADKTNEPPVVVVAQDGSAVVPVVGGHRGANDLARIIAQELDVAAAITTASELAGHRAPDDPPPGWSVAADTKEIAAELLAGRGARPEGDAAELLDWLPLSDGLVGNGLVGDGPVARAGTGPQDTFVPHVLALGVGCERGCAPDELEALARETLAEHGFTPEAVACVASLDLKADEPAVHALADTLGRPACFFTAERLERETPRLANPSDVVFREVGCHGVAEGAALTAVGEGGRLVVAKRKSARATVAVARAPAIIQPRAVGRGRGSLAVVGIGPGGADWCSPEASRLIDRATDLVGYSLYLDLAPPNDRARRHDYPLGGERDRVRRALELAGEGRDVALVCSGDAGIYAMAALVFEVLEHDDLPDGARRADVTVAPGISALQAAAARAGAPLGHDFCTISLSDLLTPWAVIERRIAAAAAGDFVVAFYNPVSRRRRTQLAHAITVLMAARGPDVPVVLATNLGREGERVRVVRLGDLRVDDVDMLTVVIVGSSETRVWHDGAGRARVYTPRGYAAKLVPAGEPVPAERLVPTGEDA